MRFDDDAPLTLSCRNCGAPLEFDIVAGSYRCAYCGSERPLGDFPAAAKEWTRARRKARAAAPAYPRAELSCPKCAARIVVDESEGSATCPFCGSAMLRREFIESADFPQAIAPFRLTREAAQLALREWAQTNSRRVEAGVILAALDGLEGFYLPYRLVKGPVECRVTRDNSARAYACAGEMDGLAVNVSKQLDNAVLDAAEPFDWRALRAFDPGITAGLKVKLADLTEKEAAARAHAEVEEQFTRAVQLAMQTTGVNIRASTDGVADVPALLPMYVLRSGNVTAVVNGQTGRVAVTSGALRVTWPWVIEPTLLTLLIAAAFWWWSRLTELALMSGLVFGLILFTVFSEGRGARVRRLIFSGSGASPAAERSLLTGPVFFEKLNGVRKPVKLRFYTPFRVLAWIAGVIFGIGLPAWLALLFTLLGGKPLSGINFGCGAAWYCLSVPVAIAYTAKFGRVLVYERPAVYELLPGGGLRRAAPEETGESRTTARGVWSFVRLLLSAPEGRWLLFGLLFILTGSVAAMLD